MSSEMYQDLITYQARRIEALQREIETLTKEVARLKGLINEVSTYDL